jgi:2-keto-3-deoxy-L-fuconate dehydrogenase
MDSERLAGKTAVVTAAASGIGRASAESFARAGARVFALDIDAQAVRTVPGCEGRVLDVRDPSAIQTLAREIGRVDILFNCAGMVPKGTVLDLEPATWNAAFELNVHSMFHMIRAFLPGMLEARTGSIINMSSVASSTKSIAADFVAQGIRCNAICPGTVDTPSLQTRLHAYGDYEKTRREFEARQPMGRLGRPEEIAALALYLASDESGFTTGQIHIIDGGWMI